jgi:hypothetical protein
MAGRMNPKRDGVQMNTQLPKIRKKEAKEKLLIEEKQAAKELANDSPHLAGMSSLWQAFYTAIRKETQK